MQAELIPVHVCSNRNRYPDLGRTEHHYPSQSHVEEALLPRGGSHTKSICMVRGDELTVVKLSRDVADPVSVRAMTMLIEQFNQRELLTLAAGGHTLEETRRMVTAGYWHQMTSHSAAMIRPTDGAVVCAAVCIPFTPLRVHVVKRIVTALRGGCMDDLADLPQGLVQYVCADRHPEVLWFLAECDEVRWCALFLRRMSKTGYEQAVSNLAQLGDGPQRSMASKLAAYSVQSGGGCTLVEEIALIASAPDSPRGAMTSLVSHILKDMWTDGVRMVSTVWRSLMRPLRNHLAGDWALQQPVGGAGRPHRRRRARLGQVLRFRGTETIPGRATGQRSHREAHKDAGSYRPPRPTRRILRRTRSRLPLCSLRLALPQIDARSPNSIEPMLDTTARSARGTGTRNTESMQAMFRSGHR